MGARRIGFLAYRNQASTVKARIAGYRDALPAGTRAGVPGDIVYVPAGSRFDLPAEALKFEAFVCANDRLAGHLMHALIERGIRLRITGIDDVNYAALLPVPLTTVHQPCRDIGETALRILLERLERPISGALITSRPVCRGSVHRAISEAARSNPESRWRPSAFVQ